MSDLEDFWLALLGVDPVALDRIGVSFRAAQVVGGVRQGRSGLILPVFVDPPSIWRDVPEPILEDLVCFSPAQPARWWTLRGAAVMLGEAAYDEARLSRLPLPVFRTPLGWLQAGGSGVFILDPLRFGISVLGYPAIELVGEDLDHARELRQLVDRIPRLPLPRVSVAA